MKSFLVLSMLSLSTAVFAQATPNPTPVPETQAERVESAWQFGVGAGLSTTTQWSFDKVLDQGQYLGEAELNYDNAFTLSLEVRNQAPNSWGAQFGINHDFEHEFSDGKITAGNTTVVITDAGGGSSSTVAITTLYANAVYQWDNFYVPFGFNWSRLKFKQAVGASGSSDADGGLGIQVGVGWAFSRNIAAEILVRSIKADLTLTDSSGDSLNMEDGNIGSIQWFVKYYF